MEQKGRGGASAMLPSSLQLYLPKGIWLKVEQASNLLYYLNLLAALALEALSLKQISLKKYLHKKIKSIQRWLEEEASPTYFLTHDL